MSLPTPYYADDAVTLYHGDALDLLPMLPRASVDVLVTDPPYLNVGTGASRVSKSAAIPNERQFFDVWMRGLWRDFAGALKADGAAWMTIDWRGAVSCEWAAAGSDLTFGGVGVWDRGGLGMGYMLRHTYECFVVARMPKWERVVTDEPDVWRVQWTPGNRTTGHEAEKPVELFRRAIRLLRPSDSGVVLDPFAGSGTTGLAARLEGRRAILIEREERYAEVAARRLERMPRGTDVQPSLFAEGEQ